MEQNWWDRFRQNLGAGWGDFMGAPGTAQNAASSEGLRRAGLALLGGATTDPYQAILQGIGTFSETRSSEMQRLEQQRREDAKLAEDLRRKQEADALARDRAELEQKEFGLREQQIARQTETQQRTEAEHAAQIERNKGFISNLPESERAAAAVFAEDPKAFEDWYARMRSEQAAAARDKAEIGSRASLEATRFAREQEANRYYDQMLPEGAARYDRKEGRYVGFAPSPAPARNTGEPSANARLSYESSIARANVQQGMDPATAAREARRMADERFGRGAASVQGLPQGAATGAGGYATTAARRLAERSSDPNGVMALWNEGIRAHMASGMSQAAAEAAMLAELMEDLGQ